MEQTTPTRHRVVLVRNGAGDVVRTHQVIDLGDVEPLKEEDLFEQAVAAARRMRPQTEDLVATSGTKEELDRLHKEGLAKQAFSNES